MVKWLNEKISQKKIIKEFSILYRNYRIAEIEEDTNKSNTYLDDLNSLLELYKKENDGWPDLEALSFIIQSLKALKENRFDQAIKYAEHTNYIKNISDKTKAFALNQLGRCFFLFKLYKEAETKFNEAIKLNNKLLDSYYYLIKIEAKFANKKIQKLKLAKLCNKVLKKDELYLPIILLKTNILKEAKEYEISYNYLSKLPISNYLLDKLKTSLLYELERYDEVIIQANKYPNDANMLNHKAIALYSLGRYYESYQILTSALTIVEKASLYINLSYILYEMKDFNGAIKACKKACAMEPNNKPFLIQYANILFEIYTYKSDDITLGKTKKEKLKVKALELIDYLIELTPNNIINYFNKANFILDGKLNKDKITYSYNIINKVLTDSNNNMAMFYYKFYEILRRPKKEFINDLSYNNYLTREIKELYKSYSDFSYAKLCYNFLAYMNKEKKVISEDFFNILKVGKYKAKHGFTTENNTFCILNNLPKDLFGEVLSHITHIKHNSKTELVDAFISTQKILLNEKGNLMVLWRNKEVNQDICKSDISLI